jgi:formate hydrogenlyase subunit 6/NADH:ubiquinone oxidoreductase subunit I
MRIGVMLGDVMHSLVRRPITERYPFERHPTPERLRGALNFQPEKCSGCGICGKDCPANAIELITLDKKNKKFVIRYHVDRCTFCAQCVKSCNYKCLSMSSEQWELAALGREAFTVCYGNEVEVRSFLAQLTGAGPRQAEEG